MKTSEVEHRPEHKSIRDLLDLHGKVAVVTGGARGIGAEIALRLSEAEARVMIIDSDGMKSESTAKEISAESGGEVLAREVDVQDAEGLLRAAYHVTHTFGGLDIWVNNAGIFPSQDTLDVSSSNFMKVIYNNLLGAHLGLEAAVDRMRKSDSGGVIINIISTPSFGHSPAYLAANAALGELTRLWAAELGREGIRVVALAPAATDTPGFKNYKKEEGQIEKIGKDVPLQRIASAEDVARAALFMASDAADFITGVTLPIDGGEGAARVLHPLS